MMWWNVMNSTIPIYFDTPEDIFEFFQDNPHLFVDALYDAIKQGIDEKLDMVNVFDLNDTGIYVSSTKDEWLVALQMIQEIFNDKEEYEKSKEVQQYINKL